MGNGIRELPYLAVASWVREAPNAMGQDWRICRLGACHALFFEPNLDRPRPAHSSASKPGTEQCPAGKTQIHRTQPADLRLGTRETRQSQPDAELLGQGGGSPAWQSDSTPMLHSKGGEHNRGTAGSSAGNFVHQVWWTRDPVLASRCDRREMLLEFGSILSAIYHVTAPACRHSRHADSSVCCTKRTVHGRTAMHRVKVKEDQRGAT